MDKQGKRRRRGVLCSAEKGEDVRGVIRGICQGYGYDRTSRVFPAVAAETAKPVVVEVLKTPTNEYRMWSL